MWSTGPATSLSLFLLPIISALQIPSILAPFYEPYLDGALLLSNQTLEPTEHELLKRSNNCPLNFNSCSTFAAAAAGACCTVGSLCTLDNARSIACCPIGATCTGTVNRPATATSGAIVTGSAAATTTTTTTGTSAATITATATYVPNTYFPFPFIPTTYANSAACISAVDACQSNYAACTQDLTGGAYGVTISAPNGGITVAPTVVNVGIASATSICSSLSAVACYGIASSNCAQFGTSTAVGASFIVPANAAAKPTMGCMAAAGVMAGLGLGIAAQMV